MFRARRALLVVAALLLLALGATACASDDPPESPRDTVTVVGQKFTEADIVGQLYTKLLEKDGYRTRTEEVGARDLYVGPLGKNEVQVSTDYLSTMTEALNREVNGDTTTPVSSPDVDATMAQLTTLGLKHGITPLQPARAESGNGFAVTRDFAERFHLETLSDLAALGKPVTLAADPDCSSRPDCAQGLKSVYGIELAKVAPLGLGSDDIVGALTRGDVQLGQVGTTDGALDSHHLVLLQDDKNWQNAENVVPMVNTTWIDKNPRAKAVLESLSAVLTTADLRALNSEVDTGGKSPSSVAEDYLAEKGLL